MPTGIGLLVATIGVGIAVGFPLGGLMIDRFGLPAIFWIAAAMAALTAVAIAILVPESPVRTPGRIDFAGTTLISVGLVAVLAAISRASDWGWLEGPTLLLVVSGLAALAVFVLYERTRTQPLVDVRTLLARPLLANNCATVLIAYAGIGAFVLVPLLAQVPRSTGYGLGVSAGQSGLFLLPSAFATIIAAPLAGRLVLRLGGRALLISGALLGTVAIGLLAVWHSSPALLALWSSVFGLGTGLSYAAMPVLVVESVPQRMTGEATGINTLLRNVGNALGTQVSTSILVANVAAGTGLTTDLGFTLALGACALAGLLGTGIALLVPRWRGPAG